ncbi:MAG: hypothetical protein QXG00_08260 [Candidatus Woesearchaeota archaeon]
MSGKIIVFNSGSATLKFKLFDVKNNKISILKRGLVDNIGQGTGPKNHKVALSILFQGIGVGMPSLGKIENLKAIGHRVVYGGDKFSSTTLVTKKIIKELEKYNFIAPLHNPKIIEVMNEVISQSGHKGHRDIPNYAVFDSHFFKDLPDVSKIYPLPYRFYTDYGIKRNGFHGISHKFVVSKIMEKYPNVDKIISVHLGGGCSVAAVKDGKPIDTSMGFTPLEGLMMTTRPGDIDVGIIHYLIEKKILKHSEVDHILNNESGLLGISGLDNDMRELLYVAGYEKEDPDFQSKYYPSYITDEKIKQVRLAIDMFIYRIKKYIGAYTAILGGCDVLIITGKMGYGSKIIRSLIMSNLDFILRNSKVEVIETDEEYQIASEIVKLIEKEE